MSTTTTDYLQLLESLYKNSNWNGFAATTKERLLKQYGSIWDQYGTHDTCINCKKKYIIKSYTQKHCLKCGKHGKGSLKKKTDKWYIFNRDNFRCVYCGKATWNSENIILHCDHIVPQSRGGQDIASNLATSCSSCNVAKSDFIPSNKKDLLEEIKIRNKKFNILPNKMIKGFK